MRNGSLYETVMWCGRRMEKISRTDRVRNEGVLKTVTGRKASWTGHILNRNCLLKHVNEGKIEGRIEVMERRVRKRKQLLDDLKQKNDTGK
jgi:hypothetical protein